MCDSIYKDALRQILVSHLEEISCFIGDTFCFPKVNIENISIDSFGSNVVDNTITKLFLKYSEDGDIYTFKYNSESKVPFKVWEHYEDCSGLSCNEKGCYEQ
jgi:hypothetical protein